MAKHVRALHSDLCMWRATMAHVRGIRGLQQWHDVPQHSIVSEQAALGQFNQLQARITSLEQAGAAQQEAALQLQARLEGQLSINRQLMSKKEDVEWQLMDALAKVAWRSRIHHTVNLCPTTL
eukprot:scaffold28785_cov21-Tisochrysis_lutea.AAC.2